MILHPQAFPPIRILGQMQTSLTEGLRACVSARLSFRGDLIPQSIKKNADSYCCGQTSHVHQIVEICTLLRLYLGEAVSSWPLVVASALIFGSNTTKDLIMKSSAMTLPMAAAPAKTSTCAVGIVSHFLCSATGSATAKAATHIACSID